MENPIIKGELLYGAHESAHGGHVIESQNLWLFLTPEQKQ